MSSEHIKGIGVVYDHNKNAVGVEYAETTEKLVYKDHFHNSHEIILVVEGTAEFIINGKTYSVTHSNIIFISNLEAHELKVVSTPYKRYLIHIKPDFFNTSVSEPVLASILNHRPRHFNHVIPLDSDEMSKISEIAVRMHSEITTGKLYSELCLKSYLHLLLVSLYRSYANAFPLSSINKTVKNIIDIQKYVDSHYAEPITLKKISEKFFTDMYYLSHMFKKTIGFSFRDYLILQRISKAKDLLFYTDEEITLVSLNSGFNNMNNFIRTFKNYEGITPYQYRKKYKKG